MRVARRTTLITTVLALIIAVSHAARPKTPRNRACDRTVPDECPGMMGCYAQSDVKKSEGNVTRYGDGSQYGVCLCYSFYGSENMDMDEMCEDGLQCGMPDCPCTCEPGSGSKVLVGFLVLALAFNFWWGLVYALVTMAQMRRAGGLKINTATIALSLCIGTEIALCILHVVYIVTVAGADRSYAINDSMRPPLFSLWVVGIVGSLVNVIIMWLDVISKTKTLKSKSTTVKKLKIGAYISIVLLCIVTAICMSTNNQVYIVYYAAVYLVVLQPSYLLGGRKLANDLSGGNIKQSPTSQAILCVSNRIAFLIIFVFLSLGTYVILGRNPTSAGTFGFGGIIALLIIIGFCVNILVGYIRFGARKKLGGEGYMDPTAITKLTTSTTKIGTVSPETSDTTTAPDETPRSDGRASSGKTISNMTATLNRVWALGFPVIA